MEQWWDRMIAEARAQKMGWADLARQIGASPDMVRKWAQGKAAKPRGDALERISKALDVEVVWLQFGTGPRRQGEETDETTITTAEIGARSDFGTRVKGARVRLGMTVDRACIGLSISRRRWDAIEIGNVSPSLIELQLISERLRESLDWLVSGYVEPLNSRDTVAAERVRQTMLHEDGDSRSGK